MFHQDNYYGREKTTIKANGKICPVSSFGNTLALLGQATPVILASVTRDDGDNGNYMLDEVINYTNGIL